MTNNYIERYFGVMKDVLLRGRQLTSLVALMTLLNGDPSIPHSMLKSASAMAVNRIDEGR